MRLATLLLAVAFAIPAFAAPEAKSNPLDDSAQIAEKLLERMSLDQQLDKASLHDALRYLQDRTGLTILVDKKSLRERNEETAQTIDDSAVSLPAMKNVRIETVLRKIVDQLDLDYVITPDHVSITTTEVKDALTGQAKRLPELYPRPDRYEEGAEQAVRIRTTPYVTASFKDTIAADALKDIASRSGRTVVISEGAAEKTKTPVTVNLSNVAFESAAASLAEAAGLRAFRNGNVVVIVTAERAKDVELKGILAATGSVVEFDRGICAGFGEKTNLEAVRRIQEQIIKAKMAKLTAELEALKQK